VSAGLVDELVSLVKDETNVPLSARLLALISLTNVAIHPESHHRLRECGSIEMAAGLLRYLHSQDMQQLDFGLSAAFLICRVAGRDEVGVGMESIQSNVTLVAKLKWILLQVLQAGPEGIVLGSHWNPANIVLDISILAQSDRNKVLLKEFIPLVVEALEICGKKNQRLVQYSLAAITELYTLPEMRKAIDKEKYRILAVLEKMNTSVYDLSTYQRIVFLNSAYEQPPKSLQDTLRKLYVSMRDRLMLRHDSDAE